MSILENIHGHRDLAALNDQQRALLCGELRAFLVENVSRTGGHVASNLGVVELTVALETVFDTETDRLVFDVGHQAYVHKLLTGRQADFSTLRQYGGIAGFPKPGESKTDAFIAGHASSSVSIALGMARARTLQNEDYNVVALIGDGAATGGLAFEGLNDAAVSKEPLIVILNDNKMSIDNNVGGLAKHLSILRTREQYLGFKEKYRAFTRRIPGGKTIYRFTHNLKERVRRMLLSTTIFENMGFTYFGPVDGHDLPRLIALLRRAKEMRSPVVIHVVTQKGRGYGPAENNPKLFHGIGKFDAATGAPLKKATPGFSDAFGEKMVQLASQNDRLCAITAAMPGGTGLLPFKEKYPQRLFDVGIAEGHAVSMAGGLAKQGMIPVFAVYSTFLQRSYDMLLQDICMQKLLAVFAVDRAGLVGEDGETHHGVFDVGYLRHCPGMQILCPASRQELRDMLTWAVSEQNGPVAIRYPRGGDRGYSDSAWEAKPNGALNAHAMGKNAVLITYGTLLDNVLQAREILEKQGVSVTVLRLLTLSPLPIKEVLSYISTNVPVCIFEETMAHCGVGETLMKEIRDTVPGCRVYHKDLGEKYIPHGAMDALYTHCGLNGEQIASFVREVCRCEN